jgi:hypothetical protein
MQSSEDAIDAVMGELWAQQGYTQPTTISSSPPKQNQTSYKRQLLELSGYPDNGHMAGNHSIWNPYVTCPSNDQILDNQNRLRGPLPTNPQVEIVRRRAFEKFKQDCVEIINRVLGSWGLKLPLPAILEKWHMDAKLAEAQEKSMRKMKHSPTYPLISSTEEIYRLVIADPKHEFRSDPILLAKQATDHFQATLEPEVEKAWTIKLSAQEETTTNKKQATLLPPKAGKKFQQIKRALHKCICEAEETFHHQLRQAVQLAQQQTQQQKQQNGKRRKLPKITRDSETDQYNVTYNGISLRLHGAYFEKLQRLFDRAHDGQSDVAPESFDESLFALLCRYDMLQGAGLQAGVPGRVMDTLLLHFECKMECFASPFNCRYERFTSAFDLDRHFGSLGSFFDLDDNFFVEEGGCFEANPPFCEGVIDAMNDRIRRLLTRSSKALMFVVFVPAWRESKAYQEGLMKNPFLEKHLLLPSGKHWYAEGTQHRRKGSFRPASFDTSIMFYHNDAAKAKWPINSTVIEDLKQAFCDDPGSMKKAASSPSVKKTSAPVDSSRKISTNTRKMSDDVDHNVKKPSRKRKGAEAQYKIGVWTDPRDESSAQLGLLQSLGLTSTEQTTTSTMTTFSESKRTKKQQKSKA